MLALLSCLAACMPMSPRQGSEVIVLSTPDDSAPSGFVDALRIQLAGSAAVVRGPTVSGTSSAQRIDSATAALTGPHSLAVWVERAGADGNTDYVLYVVGSKRGRALIEVFRLPAAGGPEADRALALKVHEVLDQLLLPEPTAADQASWVRETPPPPPPPPPAGRPIRASGLVELSGSGATSGSGTQAGGRVAIGGRIERGSVRAELAGIAQLESGFDDSGAAGRVETSELGVGGGVRALYRRDRLAGGLAADFIGRRVSARGTTPFGARGDLTRWLGATLLAVDLRFAVSPAVELRAGLGTEIAWRRQRFSVNGITLLDLGRMRTIGQIGAIVRIR